VLELAPTEASVVLCVAEPPAVDVVTELGDVLRVAPDEALLLASPGSAGELVAAATRLAAELDEDAVVLEATDGWAIWTLRGDRAREAFAHLSALELPGSGFTQGEVAGVAAKVLVDGERIHLLVPSMWEAHLRERIVADCAHLGAIERDRPSPWGADTPDERAEA